MTSKSVFYLFFMAVASFSISIFFRNKFSVEEGYIARQFILVDSLKLVIVPMLLLMIFDPILFVYKRYVRKMKFEVPRGWQLFDSIVESIFAYWICYALFYFFFLKK